MNSENPTPKTDKQVIDNFRRGGRMIEKREWISDRELQAFLKGNLPIDPQGVVFQLAMKQLSGQTVTPNEQQYLKLSPSSVHHQYEQALTQYGGKQLSLLPKLNYIDELTGELLKRQGYSPVNTAQLTLAIAAKHSNGGRLTESERGFLQTVERHNQQKFTYVTDVAVDDLLKPEPFAMAQEPATPFPKTALLPKPETPQPETPPNTETPEQSFGHYHEKRLEEVVSHTSPEGGTKPLGHNEKDDLLVAEYIQASEEMILLPSKYEHLRVFFENDGFLSNEEINRSLYNARLTETELKAAVDRVESKASSQEREQIADYLWDVHESVKHSPLMVLQEKDHTYRLVSSEIDKQQAALASDGRSEDAKANDQMAASRKHSLLDLNLLNGGMIANFIHNYRIMQALSQRNKQPQKNTMNVATQPNLANRFDYGQVAPQLEHLGLNSKNLNEADLNELLNGRRTSMLSIEKTDGKGNVTPVVGKIYIAEVPGQGPVVFIQPRREKLDLPKFFLGQELTDQDRNNLQKTGELGRVLEMRDKDSGLPFKGFVSVDPETNRLTVMRQDRVHIPHTMHGVKLTPEQQESIREGKPTRIEGMIGPKDGKPFDAYVQASPAIRRFKFRRIPEQQLKEELKNAPRQTVKNEGPVKANKKVQGKQPEAEKQKVGAKQKGEADQKKETKTNVSVQEKNGLSRTTVNQSQVKTNGPKTNSPAVKPTQKNTDQVEVVSNKPEKAAKVKSTRKIKR